MLKVLYHALQLFDRPEFWLEVLHFPFWRRPDVYLFEVPRVSIVQFLDLCVQSAYAGPECILISTVCALESDLALAGTHWVRWANHCAV